MVGYVNKKKEIASDLAAYKAAFDQTGIPWVIIGGVVLGYARYKDIMDWDTDSDIVVPVELTNDRWQDLRISLAKNGLRFPPNKVDFMYCYRRTECNMEFYHKDGDVYNCFPKSTPGLKFVEKAMWYDEPQIVDFLGSKYPIPNHVEDFVAAHYGLDWKTNIVKDHKQYFTDKRGGRDQSKWLTSRAGKHGDLWPKILKLGDSMEIK